MTPLAIDLCCGLGGWAEGLLAAGYYVVGFDIERHVYGKHHYPAQLVLQDVLTLHGSQFKDAALIVASPPCQEFSYMAMPWKRSKQIMRSLRGEDEFPDGYAGSRTVADLTKLFDACFRLQREACKAAGRHIPLIVENVKGAQPWVGRARWAFGSFYLWGDVPALMPTALRAQKFNPDGSSHPPGSWFAIADSRNRGAQGIKNAGGSWFGVAHNKTSGVAQNPRDELASGQKVVGGIAHIRDGFGHTRHLTNPAEHQGVKHHASGEVWFDTGPAAFPSRSARRKFASAMIAKIPPPLSQHIAEIYLPRD